MRKILLAITLSALASVPASAGQLKSHKTMSDGELGEVAAGYYYSYRPLARAYGYRGSFSPVYYRPTVVSRGPVYARPRAWY